MLTQPLPSTPKSIKEGAKQGWEQLCGIYYSIGILSSKPQI